MTILLACVFFVGCARVAAAPDSYEPNDSVQAARTIAAGSHALTIDRMGDIDYFNISITAGHTITIDITTDSTISIQLSGPAGLITSAGATSSAAGQLVHLAAFTGNHTIVATNAVSCEYNLVITITAPAPPGPDTPPGPETPGYEPVLVMAASLAAIVAV